MYLVGVADDLVGVGYRYKFVIQILAALLFPLSGLWINDLGGLLGLHEIPAYIGMPLTVFLTVYITNAINLIDGIDGLASGLSCIALGLLIIVCALVGQWTHAFWRQRHWESSLPSIIIMYSAFPAGNYSWAMQEV